MFQFLNTSGMATVSGLVPNSFGLLSAAQNTKLLHTGSNNLPNYLSGKVSKFIYDKLTHHDVLKIEQISLNKSVFDLLVCPGYEQFVIVCCL